MQHQEQGLGRQSEQVHLVVLGGVLGDDLNGVRGHGQEEARDVEVLRALHCKEK
jgi:hypothetical protein